MHNCVPKGDSLFFAGDSGSVVLIKQAFTKGQNISISVLCSVMEDMVITI